MKKNLNFIILLLFVITVILHALEVISFLLSPEIIFKDNASLFFLIISSLIVIILLFFLTVTFILSKIEKIKFKEQITTQDFFEEVNQTIKGKKEVERKFNLFLNSIVVSGVELDEHIQLCTKEIKNKNTTIKKLTLEKNHLNNNAVYKKNSDLQKENLNIINQLKLAQDLIMVLELKLKKFESVEKQTDKVKVDLLNEFNHHKKITSLFSTSINDIEALFVNFKSILDNLRIETQSIILLSINLLIEANKLDTESGFIVACTKLRSHVEKSKNMVREALYENENFLYYSSKTKNTVQNFLTSINTNNDYDLTGGGYLVSDVLKEIEGYNQNNSNKINTKEVKVEETKQFFYNNTNKTTTTKVDEFDNDDTDFGKY